MRWFILYNVINNTVYDNSQQVLSSPYANIVLFDYGKVTGLKPVVTNSTDYILNVSKVCSLLYNV